jgi:arsenical pump membrane protein
MSVIVFAITLTLIIWRPKGLGIGFSALGGALLALATGVVTLDNIWAIRVILGNTTFTLLAFLAIRWLLEKAGIFPWVASFISPRLFPNGRFLFIGFLLGSAIASLFLSNYGSLLLITPIAWELLTLLNFKPRTIFAFIIAIGFMSDWASLAFTSSNVINTIASSYAGINFSSFASVMLWVNGIAIVTGIGILLFYFGRVIPLNYQKYQLIEGGEKAIFEIPDVYPEIREITHEETEEKTEDSNSLFYFDPMNGVVYTSQEMPHLRSANPANISKIKILLKIVNNYPVLQIILFLWGMSVIFIGLGNAGLTNSLSGILGQFGGWGTSLGVIFTGILITIQASVMNNVPTILSNMLAMQTTPITNFNVINSLVYAAVIACVIGAKISPFGSLSTLLLFDMLQQRGLNISWRDYFKMATVITLPVFFVSLLTLIIWLQ